MIGYFEWVLSGFLANLEAYILVGAICLCAIMIWSGCELFANYFIWTPKVKKKLIAAILLWIGAFFLVHYVLYYLSAV